MADLDNNERVVKDDRNRLFRFFEVFGNVFGLNICFVIACLPIFTIGASLTALYSMCIRLQENEEETIVYPFITEFKKNFKQATLTWLAIVAAFVVMIAEYLVIKKVGGVIGMVYLVVLFFELLFVVLALPFLFALIARYKNDFFGTIKNSILLAIGYFGSWLKIVVAWIAPVLFTFYFEPIIFLLTWYLWVLLIPAIIAYGTSFTIRKVFRINAGRVEKTSNEKKDNSEEKSSN